MLPLPAQQQQRPPPIAKRSHRKSRGGCRSCKSRRVKCDERKPLCRNCERHYTGLTECEWDPVAPTAGPSSRGKGKSKARQSSNPSQREAHSPASNLSVSTCARSGMVEPFDRIELPENLSPDDLLPFYLTSVVYQCFPFFGSQAMVEEWTAIMQAEPLLVQIALSTTAFQLERRLGRREAFKSTELTSACLNILQARLNDGPQACSDSTMIAISQLIALENDTGNVRTVKLHTQALQRMIAMRGNLDNIEASSPLAASMIFWTAMVASSEPSRLPIKFPNGPGSAESLLSPRPQASIDLRTLNVDARLSSLLNTADLVYHHLNALAFARDSAHGFAVVSELCHTVQHLLVFEYSSELSDPFVYLLNESARRAGALYLMMTPERYYPSTRYLVTALVHSLKRSLVYALDQSPLNEEHPVLLWTLCIGSVASQRLPEHRWFVDHLAFLLDQTSITTEEELRERVGMVMSFASFHEFTTREIWSRVETRLSTE